MKKECLSDTHAIWKRAYYALLLPYSFINAGDNINRMPTIERLLLAYRRIEDDEIAAAKARYKLSILTAANNVGLA